MDKVELIAVSKGADYLEVHPTTLANHKALGWAECAKREVEEVSSDNAKLTLPQLKDALVAKGIEVPEGAKKADLIALLDAGKSE